MKFLLVVWEAAGERRPRLILSLIASTLGSAGVLISVNSVLSKGETARGPDLAGLVLFLVMVAAVVGGHAVGQRTSAAIVEELLDRLRIRSADLIRRADYGRFEAIGGQAIYDALSRNSSTLTEAAMMAIYGVAAFGALILGGFYTLTLSSLVFAVIATMVVGTFVFYRLTQHKTREVMVWANQVQERFYRLLRHLLDGFKEVKLHEPRGDSLEHRYLAPESDTLRDAQIGASIQINRGINVSLSLFYLMVGTIAFLLPPLVGDQEVIMKAVYVAIYMLGLVEAVQKAVPMVTRASFAIDELNSIEETLEKAAQSEPERRAAADFERLEGVELLYSYHDRDGQRTFTMGPTSLELSKGELLFIVGGNGSGKSTLLKTFTRLYRPQSGKLLWDGAPVDEGSVRAYRSLFSTVFSDFHLFDRLYGLEAVPEARVNALLADLGIAHKTAYRDGRFTTTDLSTGQRKRLALAVALLEERPVLVLDELAADQDPDFRRRFYDELVPRWKAEGRTLVIVSHDDRYFHIADRTLILADGRAADGRAADGRAAEGRPGDGEAPGQGTTSDDGETHEGAGE